MPFQVRRDTRWYFLRRLLDPLGNAWKGTAQQLRNKYPHLLEQLSFLRTSFSPLSLAASDPFSPRDKGTSPEELMDTETCLENAIAWVVPNSNCDVVRPSKVCSWMHITYGLNQIYHYLISGSFSLTEQNNKTARELRGKNHFNCFAEIKWNNYLGQLDYAFFKKRFCRHSWNEILVWPWKLRVLVLTPNPKIC